MILVLLGLAFDLNLIGGFAKTFDVPPHMDAVQ